MQHNQRHHAAFLKISFPTPLVGGTTAGQIPFQIVGNTFYSKLQRASFRFHAALDNSIKLLFPVCPIKPPRPTLTPTVTLQLALKAAHLIQRDALLYRRTLAVDYSLRPSPLIPYSSRKVVSEVGDMGEGTGFISRVHNWRRTPHPVSSIV